MKPQHSQHSLLEINMNMKQSTLASAIIAALAVGAAGQAAASIYARSYLDIANLHINVAPFGPGVASIGAFDFNATNTAFLNSVGGGTNATCSGTFGGATTCGPAGNRLDPLVFNAPGSTLLQGENTFTFHGPGAGQYANSDGKIFTAAVAGDVVAGTHTTNIAESELQTGTSASSSSLIDSNTGFTFNFSLAGPGTMTVTFDAIQNMLAAINDPTGLTHSALATMNTVLTISTDSGAFGFLNYTPDGSTATGCVAVGIFTCLETLDPFSLNVNAGTSTDGTSVPIVHAGSFATSFGIGGAGNYTLTLSEKKSTSLSRSVPEPGVLALMGIGLMGLGMSARRRNKKQA
jgi:hypothetical protein